MYQGFHLFHCKRVSGCVVCTHKKCWFAQKRLNIHETLWHFNFQNDVVPLVYAGQSFLNAKRVLWIVIYMYQKGWVAWKGLVILNNEITFWFRGGLWYLIISADVTVSVLEIQSLAHLTFFHKIYGELSCWKNSL